MAIIRTLQAPLRHEGPKIKGSRFITSLAPIAAAEDAEVFVASRRAEFHDATHNCFAWRLDAEHSRSSDDGEPSGTAGRPMLRELEGRELVGLVAVVTRYYGGTKLGTGGLARAYSGAVAMALDEAEIVETPVTRTLHLHFAYELSGAVLGTLNSFGITPGPARYESDVRMEVAVPEESTELLRTTLIDAAAGQIEITESS